MAERDRVIKSGQFTLPRLLFLAIVGGVIVFTVYAGGLFLALGYWMLTLGMCILLFLIAIDYHVTMDKISLTGQTAETSVEAGAPASAEVRTTMGEGARAASAPRPKRRASRPAKRRR